MLRIPDFPCSPFALKEPVQRAVQTLDDRCGIKRIETLRRIEGPHGGESVRVRGVSEPKTWKEQYHLVEIRAYANETDPKQFAYNYWSARSYGEDGEFFEGLAVIFSGGLYLLKRLRTGEKARRAVIQAYDCNHGSWSDRQCNFSEVEKMSKPVPLLQDTLAEAERRLGRSLTPMDTGTPEKYLEATTSVELRVAAFRLGADAIIHCQPGSAIGTPVKYVK